MDFSMIFSIVISSLIVYRIVISWQQNSNNTQQDITINNIKNVNSYNNLRDDSDLLAIFLCALGVVGLICYSLGF